MTSRHDRAAAVLVSLLLGGCARCGGGAPEPALPALEEEPLPGFSGPLVYGDERRTTILDVDGPGVALFDADGDGDMDLYVGQGSTIGVAAAGRPGARDRFYVNEGGGRFVDATDRWGLDVRGWSQGVAVGDVDGDGDRDLYVTRWGPNVLLRNDGGHFTDVTAEAGVGDDRWATSAAFGDLDGDGDADLYVANYLDFDARAPPAARPGMPCRWKGVPVSCGPEGLVPQEDVLYLGRGDGTFEDASRRVRARRPGYGLGVLVADVDDDADLDVYVANDSAPNLLFLGRGDGTFEERGLFSGLSHSGDGKEQASMGIALGDPDGDGDPDLFVSHFSDDHHTLYRNRGGGLFEDATFAVGLGARTLPRLGWGVAFLDLDLDGDEDLFVAHGHVYPQAQRVDPVSGFAQADAVYENAGDGRFTPAAWFRPVPHVGRAAAFGDVDDDGDPDVVVLRLDAPPVLLRSRPPAGRHWLRVRLVGPAGNPDGVGARVRLYAGGRTFTRWAVGGGSFQAASDPRLLFGLGSIGAVDRAEVRWPGGRIQAVAVPGVDRELVVSAGGSS